MAARRRKERQRTRERARQRERGGEQGPRTERRWLQWTLVAFFLLLLILPLAGAFSHSERPSILEENRYLAPRPSLPSAAGLMGTFQREFDAYFNDNFAFRQNLIRRHNHLLVHGLGVSPLPRVGLGKEGWLYFLTSSDTDPYHGVRPFTPRELKGWGDLFTRQQNLAAKVGARYLLILTPKKATIYPEYVPATSYRTEQTRLEQLSRHLRDHTQVNFINVTDAVLERKKRYQVYFKTDTHWNNYGAHAAYEAVMGRLSEGFPTLRVHPLSDFTVSRRKLPGMDLARMMGIPHTMSDEHIGLVPKFQRKARKVRVPWGPKFEARWRQTYAMERRDLPGPTAVMYGDSFNIFLAPYFHEHFRRIAFYWSHDLDSRMVERVRPELLIFQLGERFLDGTLSLEQVGRPPEN